MINREYCKKVLVLLAGQSHPTHTHGKKEETFNVLSGEMSLTLSGETQTLKAGDIATVGRGVKHSFSTESGVVFEEISTTNFADDSYYEEDAISRNSNRKTNLLFRAEWINSEW